MKTLKEALQDWVELDDAIHRVAYCIGLIPEGTIFPKWVYWSANPIGDMLGNIFTTLIEQGVLERRDGESDYELRWNPAYKPPSKESCNVAQR